MPHEPASPAASPPPAEYWTQQEKWIWARTLEGEVADFNVRYDEPQRASNAMHSLSASAKWRNSRPESAPNGAERGASQGEGVPLDPSQDDPRWCDDDKPRLVSEKFLLDVLGLRPYAEAISSRGLRITGARFDSDLDLAGLNVDRLVWLEYSRFEGAVNLEDARFETQLSCRGSAFKQVLNMVFAKFCGQLDANGATFADDVYLVGAEVDGNLGASDTTFDAYLTMAGLTVGQNMFLAGARFAGEVNLAGAKVAGLLDVSDVTFEAGLNMNSITVGQNMFLAGARFAGEVNLAGAKVARQLSAKDATFEAGLNMNSITVGQNMFLAGARFAGEVNLAGAKVDGDLDASGANFEAGLIMNGLTVGQSTFLSQRARFAGKVDLAGAKVDGQLDVSGATFEAGLIMDDITVGESMLLDGARFAGDVDLLGAKVDGRLDARDATFEAGLNMDDLMVKQRVLLGGGATFAGEVSAVFAEVGAIYLGGATFRASINVSGLSTKGELRLTPPPTWGDGARFVLRNAHVGSLNDGGVGTQNPWPKRGELELDGFSYGRLVLPRTVRWYIDDWLASDMSYTPQPYQQLAGVLRAHGNPSAADDVLFAARERERSEACKARAWPRWLGLSLLRWTIGYGLGWRYFLVLIPILLFTLGGAVILWRSGADKVPPAASITRSVAPAVRLDEAGSAAQEHVLSDPEAAAPQAEPEDRQGFGWCLWASFDWMLPFIELDEASSEAVARLQGGPGYLLYVQALAGYVLAGFLAAGLAGLTQSRR